MSETKTPAPKATEAKAAAPPKEEAKTAEVKAPVETKHARDSLLTPSAGEKKPSTKEQFYRILATRANEKVQDAFALVAERVHKKYGEEIKLRQIFGDGDGRDILVLVFQNLFGILLQPDPTDGNFKEVNLGIPGGYGSLQLTTAGATTKMTPQKQVVQVPLRWRVKYAPGKAVEEQLKQLPPPDPAIVKSGTPTTDTEE